MSAKIDRCENHFCLYWEKSRCLLSYVELGPTGCCESCIQTELPEKYRMNETAFRMHFVLIPEKK